MDVVIHLAAYSDDGEFRRDLLLPNVVGVHNLLEAMRVEQVPRLILASSVHVVDYASASGRTLCVMERSPITEYGLVKNMAEDMCSMHCRVHELSCIAARLGWVLRDEREHAELRSRPDLWGLYLSSRDVCRLFLMCARASFLGFHVVYAVNCQKHGPVFDMTPARELLGYVPVDSFLPGP
jgi:hypothetical protein